jgi:aromatic-L-amino-acid decarboxylase
MEGSGLQQLDSHKFRELGGQMLDKAVSYLEGLPTRLVLPTTSYSACEELFEGPVPQVGIGADAFSIVEEMFENGRAQNGRFWGYVMGNGEPVAALGDFIASVWNQNLTAWRASPAAITIERTVIKWLASLLGLDSWRGTLTTGGSLANLMGLAMARESLCAANETGVAASPKVPVLYASKEVHMSIGRAVALLGLGRAQLRLIDVDKQFKMSVPLLEEAIEKDLQNGFLPIAIVASAGTVNTGAVDPLSAIVAVARRHNCWVHVDGAFGVLSAIARPQLFKGLDGVDSVSLDPHKWLYMPMGVGCILYRDVRDAKCAFSFSGSYTKPLFADADAEGFAFFDETIELSKRFNSLKLYLSLRYHGVQAFRVSIERDFLHAQLLARLVSSQSDLLLMAPVELSVVCFRHIEGDNAFNLALLKGIIQRGHVYLSNCDISGFFCLRACFVNYMTTEKDVHKLISEVSQVAQSIK